MTWFRRWQSRLDVIALRLGYVGRGPEHRASATTPVIDEDGLLRGYRVMTIDDVPAFIEAEFERSDPVQAAD